MTINQRPVKFQQIDIGNPLNEKKAREAIYKYRDRMALVKDSQLGDEYWLGKLEIIEQDLPVNVGWYNLITFGVSSDTRERKLRFENLEGLMVGEKDSIIAGISEPYN